MAAPFACSFNIFYIYQAFILFFHEALHPPHLSLSFCLSYLSVVPHPVFLIRGISLRFGDVNFSSCNPNFFAVRNIHYPVNTSSDHFHTETVLPYSGHCRTHTLLPPSGRYCIETVGPSGDHYCIDILVPSSDHCCTETVSPSIKVAPPSDHLHTKIT